MTQTTARPDTVLVVVPVRNRPRLVVRTLDTVLAQTRPPDELVVVDDGSTDGDETPRSVAAWIRDRSPSFPARLVRQAHRGLSAARNAGIASGRPADWVGLLDSDDLWPPDLLARCLAASRRAPGAVAVSADQRFVEGAAGEARDQHAASLEDAPGEWLLSNEPCLCSCSLLRADRVRALGGFDETLRTGEDIQVLLPLTLAGPWLHAPGDPVVYQRGTSDDEDMNNSRRYADRFRRWARIYDALLARPDLRATIDPKLRADRLGYYWFTAGEELFVAHNRGEARGCFARSLRYRPFHRKTWSRWAKCFMPYHAKKKRANARALRGPRPSPTSPSPRSR